MSLRSNRNGLIVSLPPGTAVDGLVPAATRRQQRTVTVTITVPESTTLEPVDNGDEPLPDNEDDFA